MRILHGSNGDFLEKYFPASLKFCRHTFELVMTLIILIEYYSRESVSLFLTEGTHIWAMICLMLYGVFTALQVVPMFDSALVVIKVDQRITFYWIMHCFRAFFMFAATSLLFLTKEGKEVQFGFWILTNLVIFIVHTFFEIGKISWNRLYLQTHKKDIAI